MKKLTTVLIISVLVSGCADMPLSEQIGGGLGGGLGALIGGIGGEKLADKLGVRDSTLRSGLIAGGAGAGAAVGVVIGQKLAKYFGKQDQQNLAGVLDDTQNNQPVAWCSDKNAPASRNATPNRNVSAVQCGNANKIIETPAQAVQTSSGEECRNSKTEVLGASGQYETINTTFCRKPPSGGWSEKAA